MRKRSELIFNLALVPIDFLAITAAFVLAYIIRVKVDLRPVAEPLGAILFLKIILLIVPVWLLIFVLSGMYNLSSLRSRWEEIGKIFVAVSGGTMFMILIDFLFRQPIFPSKAVPVYGYLLSFILVALGRQIVRSIQRYLFSYQIGVHRTLLVGSGPIAQRIAQDLADTDRSGYQIVAAIDSAAGANRRLKGLSVYSGFKEFLKRQNADSLDEIIQADSALGPDEVIEMVGFAADNHLVYRFVPNQFGLFTTNSTISTMAGVPVMEIRQTPLDGWGRIVKRLFDVLGALLGLILAAPVFIIVGLTIKLTDPGPIFYRHQRLSRVGKKIGVYKFRTMYLKYCTGTGYSGKSDAEVLSKDLGKPELVQEFQKEQKLKDDPRVTPAGKLLRKSSLDELPQLINVIKGELSLVGPRPIVEAELDRYREYQSAFLALKPGITGLWQISGRSDLGYDERVKLDIYYVENWSLMLDIKILLKTFLSILRGGGAY